jgi:hypothetical protein
MQLPTNRLAQRERHRRFACARWTGEGEAALGNGEVANFCKTRLGLSRPTKSVRSCGLYFRRLLHRSTTINIRGESYRLKDCRKAGLVLPRGQEGGGGRGSFLGLGLRYAQNAPKDCAGLHSVRGQAGHS